MLKQPSGNDSNHYTSGLVEQLKARASVKRVARPNSTLFIFISESPPLAQLYKITFLVRIEADGEEALGFRFDDVKSETPREIAWGGMVGTCQSPRCFLDGSQTFLTDSISKASERCKRGWHVRIGKINQILNVLENTKDSLAMKLSLRKLDANTTVTHLVFRPPPSSTLERFYQDTLRSDQLKSSSAPKNAPSKTLNRLATNLPFTQTSQELHKFSYPSKPQRQSKLITSSAPLNPSSQLPASHVQNFFQPLKVSSTQNTPVSPRIKSLKDTPSPISSQPMITSTSSSTAPSSPQRPINDVAMPLLHTSLLTSPSPQCKSFLQEELTPSVALRDFLSPIEPPSNTSQAPAFDDSLAFSEILKENSSDVKLISPETLTIPTGNTAEKPSYRDGVLIENSKDTFKEMVCFVFPSNTRRLNERKIYIPYCDLIEVDYFEQALRSSSSTLSIDERQSTIFPSFKAVKRTITNPLICIATKVLELLCACTMFRPEAFSNFKTRKGDLIIKLLVSLSKLGFGLTKLLWKVTLEATALIFNELQVILNDVTPPTSMDSEDTQVTTSTRVLTLLRDGLQFFCGIGSSIQQYLAGVNYHYDEDSDDDLESLFGRDELVEPTFIKVKATFIIHHIGYPTFCALSNYLQHGAINFAPLSSSFEMQKDLAHALSQNDITRTIAQEFPLERRKFIESRSVKIFKDEASCPTLKLTSCSPKSIYILADKLQLHDLKRLAHQQIILGLSPMNIVRELKNPSIYNYKELRKDYQSAAKSFLGESE